MSQKKRTTRIREYLDELIPDCKPGTTLFSDEIAVALCNGHGGETNKDVGMALRERTDVKKVRDGVWVVL